jgi:Amt family ammonium transporter
MSAGWAALAGAMFLGKRKIKKSNPARITYVTWNWIMVYCLVLASMSALAANGFTVRVRYNYCCGSRSGMALIFYDKTRT